MFLSCTCLSNNQLRDEQVKVLTMHLPPFLGDLLIGRHDQIAARPRGQVADDRCFEIDFGFHILTLPHMEHNVKAAHLVHCPGISRYLDQALSQCAFAALTARANPHCGFSGRMLVDLRSDLQQSPGLDR